MVCGVDGRGSSVTRALQNIIETLVHLIIVSNSRTTYTIIYYRCLQYNSVKSLVSSSTYYQAKILNNEKLSYR